MVTIPTVITHRNIEPLLRAIDSDPYFRPELAHKAKRPAWIDTPVVLEFPVGEITESGLKTMALLGRNRYETTALTGKEGFAAQGLEGKIRVRKNLFTALMNMRDLLPLHRGRILAGKLRNPASTTMPVNPYREVPSLGLILSIPDSTQLYRFAEKPYGEIATAADYRREEQSDIEVHHFDPKGNAFLRSYGLVSWMIPAGTYQRLAGRIRDNPGNQALQLAGDAKRKWKADVKAGHGDAEEYWAGYAGAAFLLSNPGAERLYRSFHGTNPRPRKVNLPTPKSKELVAIGVLDRIDYSPYGSSGRKKMKFTHRSGDIGESKDVNSRTILATDAGGKHLYLIPQHAEYPKFTERGILG